MEDFSNADVSVSAARSVLIVNGENNAADALRGLEVFTRQDALLALSILQDIHPKTRDGQHACAAAVDALRRAAEYGRPSQPPAAA